jgi:hypothetical protein
MLGNKSSLLNAIGLGDQRSSGDLSQSGKVVFATTTLAMDVNDQAVRCDSSDGAFTVTLPSVREAAGRIYSIVFVTDNGDITIQDKNGDAAFGDITMDTATDFVILYSDGYMWHSLAASA